MSYIKPHNAITDNELLRSPTENAVYDALALKQDTGNYITQLTGEVTALGPGSASATITNNAVTNAKLAQVAYGTFKGRKTAGTGNVEDLNQADATALLNTFTDSLQGLVPASGGGTSNFLRADGSWVAISVPASANPYLSNLLSPTAINQVLLGLDGSASAPAYSFTSDSNTGIYRSASDTLNFTTGGSNRFQIESAGSVKLMAASGADILWNTDGGGNIGMAVGGGRPDTVYVKTNVNLASLTASTILKSDASNNIISLANGSEGQVLKIVGGLPVWATDATGMSNPMTTAGDIIVGGVGGAATRLALGAVDKVLVSDGTTVTYQYAGLGGGAFGTNNIILGRGKPGTLTTGTDNVLFGSSAGNNITTATNSFLVNANLRAANESYEININGYLRVQPAYFSAIGIGHTNALNPYVVSIGSGAGNGAVNRSVSIGRNSGYNAGNSAISIGDGAGGGNGGGLGGTGAISIGAAAQQYNGSVNSIAIGTLAAQGALPSGSGYNTIIGSYAGYNLNTGAFNSVLGAYSLYTSNSKNNCVGIGSYAGYNANTANEFYLDSRSSALGSNALEKTSSLFYGTFNASTPTSQTLRINAQTNLAYGVQIAAKTGATKVTANTTINLYDHYIGVDTATPAASVTITLPSAATAGAGKLFIIKDEGGSALTYNVIIARNGSDTIEGAASDLTLANNRESAYLVSDGVSNWNRI